MKSSKLQVRSVAVIGAGAAGAITAAALKAENYFDYIQVFERREITGGTWIHDRHPEPFPLEPGKLPTETDERIPIPDNLPITKPHDKRNRWEETPIYNSLTTNVPDIAMCFSDSRFPYGPFAPHYIARQYIENYFAIHKTDENLQLSTTVEDLSWISEPATSNGGHWSLSLRKHDAVQDVDIWWQEDFDAVVLANGHYSVPYIPRVEGLNSYIEKYPTRVSHSKTYRSSSPYENQKVIVIGNSASGHDISLELTHVTQHPVYLSRRSKAQWEGDEPQSGIEWKPTIAKYHDNGRVEFTDGTYLDDVDAIIYCTGYKASFPFWNERVNGRPLWDYRENRLRGTYLHTFIHDFPTLGIVGLPRTLTFRSFEYQAVALARLWSNRNSIALPSRRVQQAWEEQRARQCSLDHTKFHDVPWENNETAQYLGALFHIAGLGTLQGDGRIPPALDRNMIWAIENIRKYEPPAKSKAKPKAKTGEDEVADWIMVERSG